VKLLFDQNISLHIISLIEESFPDAKHVSQLGIENFSDIDILNFAKENKYTIVTFDGDFYDLSLFKGISPKIIWLRFNITKTSYIATILNSKYSIIEEFITTANYLDFGCLKIK
jgi:predicted nuclease of predicted toxin-antitoxin system